MFFAPRYLKQKNKLEIWFFSRRFRSCYLLFIVIRIIIIMSKLRQGFWTIMNSLSAIESWPLLSTRLVTIFFPQWKCFCRGYVLRSICVLCIPGQYLINQIKKAKTSLPYHNYMFLWLSVSRGIVAEFEKTMHQLISKYDTE